MKIRGTSEENEVTIWLPLHREWPVVSVSIVDETTQRLLWVVMHESFKEAISDGGGAIELTITRLPTTPRETDARIARTSEEMPLRYGVVPDGMRQTVPRDSTPPPLGRGRQYFAVVRETVEDHLRWFWFTAEETSSTS